MKRAKKCLSLLLTAALCAALLCITASAEASGGASSSVIPEEASQGAVRQEGDMVTLSKADGTVITFTSAVLGGTLSFTEPDPYYNGRPVELKTIIVQPGCIGYAVTPAGETLTGTDELGLASIFCYEFVVNSDGTFGLEGWHDMSLLGNTYYSFGLERESWGYSVLLTAFYADDGRYCIVTQEALDKFCQLTGIQVEGEARPAQIFTDVSPDDWYFDFVNTVVEKKLFAGNGDGTFAPENNMTYAEFLAVLSQFSGDAIPAAPAGGAWYDGYVQWAQPLLPAGIADGFDPDAAITREDMAALFGTFLSLYDYSAQPVNTGTPSFTDDGSIADYAAGGVELCYRLGIMGGNTDGSFAPDANATRAEVAVTMVQMARVMGR